MTNTYWENVRRDIEWNVEITGDQGTMADQIRLLDKILDFCGKLQTQIITDGVAYRKKRQKTRQGSGAKRTPLLLNQ